VLELRVARHGSRKLTRNYEELFDISCPQCDTMLLIVSSVVTKEQVEAAADTGNLDAHRALAEIQTWEGRSRRDNERS
jgi:hypothetical protein